MTVKKVLAAVALRPEITAGRYVPVLSPSPIRTHNTTQLGITTGVYTAAGSQALFDTDGASWCGGGCGKCYNLTSTGSAPCSTCGTGETAGASIIVMVTNLCPFNGNEQWCPAVGGTNQYGYSYHFDIMAESEVFGDNPVVEFEPVACPGQATTDWEQCVCFGQTATDDTPAGLAGTSDPATTSFTTSDVVTTTTSSTSEANRHRPNFHNANPSIRSITSSPATVPSTLSTVTAGRT